MAFDVTYVARKNVGFQRLAGHYHCDRNLATESLRGETKKVWKGVHSLPDHSITTSYDESVCFGDWHDAPRIDVEQSAMLNAKQHRQMSEATESAGRRHSRSRAAKAATGRATDPIDRENEVITRSHNAFSREEEK